MLLYGVTVRASACSEEFRAFPSNLFVSTVPFVESRIGDLEKRACQILCRLKNEENEAKEVCSRLRLMS